MLCHSTSPDSISKNHVLPRNLDADIFLLYPKKSITKLNHKKYGVVVKGGITLSESGTAWNKTGHL